MAEGNFLGALGWTFGSVFVFLTAYCAHVYMNIRTRTKVIIGSKSAETPDGQGVCDRAADALGEDLQTVRQEWTVTRQQKERLQADLSRASLTVSALPAVALVGTVMGFYLALRNTGSMDLASTDPMTILQALMNNGVSTALATTLAGQVLNVALSQIYSLVLTGPVETAEAMLKEALDLLRDRLQELS